MAEQRVTSTNLLGVRVEYRWVHNTWERGTVRALYVTTNGFPMLLIESDHDRSLVRVAPADARVSDA